MLAIASQLSRLFALWAWLLCAPMLGLMIGRLVQAPLWGLGLGAWIGVTAWGLIDNARATRVLWWLREGRSGDAPRPPGFWGELSYRMERVLWQQERLVEVERRRLTQFLAGIEASPNGVVLLDATDQVHWCNPVAAAQFGLDPGRDVGQPITNLVRMPEFVAYLKSGRWDEPVLISAPGGASSISVLVRAYGEGQRLLLSQDVTERLRTDTMRRDFVANVSHEIRTPLTVLSGFLETMRSLPLNEAERARMISLMEQQTGRMQALVSDLLTLAQLEGGPRPPADRWIDLWPAVRRAVDEAQGLSAQRHRFLVEVPEALRIAAEESELHSAVANLLTNAVRYMPAGGEIAVRWSSRSSGGGALAVTDTGIGIPREHLPRLTERFYRVDGSRSRESGGTGLGLAIVKHVMQRHDGTLEIDSTPGQGSTFRLVWPASRVQARPAAAPDEAPLGGTDR